MTTVLITLAAFIAVFSVVVVFHELGHYWAGRACGVRVEAFSLGFGRELFGWTDKLGARWRVAAIPLGGYVKFAGDHGAASVPDREALAALKAEIEARDGPGSTAGIFHFKPVWQRAIVVAAGPIANFVLAILIFSLLVGVFGQLQAPSVIGAVRAETPAAEAGLQAGDRVVEANGRRIATFGDLMQFVMVRGDETVRLTIERSDVRQVIPVTLGRTTRPDSFGKDVSLGYLGVEGVAPSEFVRVRYNPIEAVGEGAQSTWRIVEITGQYMSRVVTGRESADQLGGPLRIAGLSGQTAKDALAAPGGAGDRALSLVVRLATLVAILSVGIGLLNLLPIPILDGGHLVYYAYEAVAGRPLGEAAQEWGFRVGLALVLGLMVFATWNDLRHFGAFDGLSGLLS